MFSSRLLVIKKALMEESLLVQTMIEKGFEGILEKNQSKLQEVYALEEKVNLREIEIEKLCLQMIALHHPEGSHLRMIMMIIKINNDLERIGDLALGIVRNTEEILDYPLIRSFADLGVMAREILNMLQDSMKAFIEEDSALSLKVCRHDRVVDNLYRKIYDRLIDDAMPNLISRKIAFHINKISKNYERIADLATNIAENNIFIFDGTMTKRGPEGLIFNPAYN